MFGHCFKKKRTGNGNATMLLIRTCDLFFVCDSNNINMEDVDDDSNTVNET